MSIICNNQSEAGITCLAGVTEDDGLANGDDTVDVCDAPVLGLGGVAVDVVLLDVVHRLLLPSQLDGDGVAHDVLSEVHHSLKQGR